jgi:hypothetical protein
MKFTKKDLLTLILTGMFLPTAHLYAAAEFGPAPEKTVSPKQKALNDKLCLAVCTESISLLEKTLLDGADPNAQSEHYQQASALTIATIHEYSNIARILVAAGANPNLDETVGLDTALMKAARNDDVTTAHILIEAGANLDAYNSRALAKAIDISPFHKPHEFSLMLIDAGADLDAKNNQYYTPLIDAIANYKAHIVHALLNAGASLTKQCAGGHTALTLTKDEAWNQGGKTPHNCDNYAAIISAVQDEVTKREKLLVNIIITSTTSIYLDEKPLSIPPLIKIFAEYAASLSSFPDPKVEQRTIIVTQAQGRQAKRAAEQQRRAQERRDALKAPQNAVQEEKE